MRNLMVTLVAVVVLFVAAPSFAKVCHPKMPVTCDAAAFAQVAAPVAVKPAPAPVKPVAAAVKTKVTPKVDQAMMCGPWSKWMCNSTTLDVVSTKVNTPSTELAMMCGPWSKWMCAAPTLDGFVAPVKTEQPAKIELAMMCGPWSKWMCMASPLA